MASKDSTALKIATDCDSWEDLFRKHKVDEVKVILQRLKRQTSHHQVELQTLVGDRHSEVISLAQSISSLSDHLCRQEASAKLLSERRSVSKFDNLLDLDSIRDKELSTAKSLGCLLALADRFFAQKRYAYAARVNYMAHVLLSQNNSAQTEAVNNLNNLKARLDRTITSWIVNGDGITQDMYHAALIVNKWSPSKLVERFIAVRHNRIIELLDRTQIAAALSVTDATLFILSQFLADLCKARLSRRRLAEIPEFSSVFINTGQLRAFPDECYATNDELEVKTAGVGLEVLDVTSKFHFAVEKVFSDCSTTSEAVEIFAGIVVRTRDSVDPHQLLAILEAALSQFSNKIKSLAISLAKSLELDTSTKWTDDVNSWKRDIERLKSHVAKQASTVDGRLGTEIETLCDSTLDEFWTACKEAYEKTRNDLLDSNGETEPETVAKQLKQLDSSYEGIGQTPQLPPGHIYKQLARKLVDSWHPVPGPDAEDACGALYSLCCQMDHLLSSEYWTPSALEQLRPLIVEKLENESPSLVEHAKQILFGTKSLGDPNRLLLYPLIGA